MLRESRYVSGKPITGKDGKPVPTVIVPNDIELFKILARLPYLDVPWLAALTKRPEGALKGRLRQLKRAGYIKVADAQAQTPEARRRNLYEKLCYELAAKGIKELRPHGIDVVEKTTNILEHQAMASQVMASFEIGAGGKLRIIRWHDILDRPETPSVLRTNPHPFTFKKVAYSYRGEPHRKDVRPDGQPFGIEAEIGDELHEFFFPGIEADNSTESIESSTWARASIERKFCEYAAIAEQKLYQTQFGFPYILVPFVFRSSARLKTALRLLSDIDLPMRAKRIFLFAVHSPQPSGNMLKQPFQRLAREGVQDFSFIPKKEAA